PDGFHFAGAFNLDVGPDPLAVPLQLAIKVDSSIVPGTTVYFFQAGDYLNDDGSTRPIWWQVESGVVGTDGLAHSTSPPYPGVNGKSLYLVASGGNDLGKIQLQLALASQLAFSIALSSAGGGAFMGAFGISSI